MTPQQLNAMKLALEALEDIFGKNKVDVTVINVIKEVLAEHAMSEVQRLGQEIEQEPVAWLSTDSIGERHLCFDKPLDNDPVQPLYTAPPQPEQEPFFTEANGFPQEFVSKDRQKQAIISMTEQCAALVWERDELQKQVWLYEKNGVTCQTYRHKVEQSCSECNVQINYTTPPQRTWVGLTPQQRDEINERVYGAVPHHVAFHHAIEAKLKELNT